MQRFQVKREAQVSALNKFTEGSIKPLKCF